MPVFRYKAVDAAGDLATGEIEAANEGEIVDRLRDQGMMPMQVARAAAGALAPAAHRADPRDGKPRGKLFGRWVPKTVSRDQLLAITRELATLMRAGLPLDRALEVLIGLADSPPAAALLQQVRDDVRGGKSLSQALEVRRDVFSRFYVNIVRAGEAGGALGVVLTRLADTMERNKELRESVKSALIYPTILIGVAVMSVLVLLVWVVPQFEQTFAQAGKALPFATQVVVVVGTTLKKWWWAGVLLVLVAVAWVRRLLRKPSVRARWDAQVLRLPLVGDLVLKVEVARFSRTLATLLGNGVTLLAGLAIVKETLGNVVLAGALDGVVARLREGKGFGKPLDETGLYPKLAVQMILVGEESGRIEEMLNRVAEVYDREVAMAIKRFLSVLEPALILSLAVMIGGIVFSILLGVMGMSELVQ
ncbi:MAG: type II secretion system F family protein [Betaproteobacteria bacterium]